MARWRDVALVVTLVAVGAAALWGPKPGGGPAAASSGPGGAGLSPGSDDLLPSPSPLVAGLSLSVTDVVATTTPDHTIVTAVHLTARLRSSDVLMLRQANEGPAIDFTLTAPQSVAAQGGFRSKPPATITAGQTLSIDLTFDLRGLSLVPGSGQLVAAGALPAPGTWLLTVDLVDVAGMTHHAQTPVTVAPTA